MLTGQFYDETTSPRILWPHHKIYHSMGNEVLYRSSLCGDDCSLAQRWSIAVELHVKQAKSWHVLYSLYLKHVSNPPQPSHQTQTVSVTSFCKLYRTLKPQPDESLTAKTTVLTFFIPQNTLMSPFPSPLVFILAVRPCACILLLYYKHISPPGSVLRETHLRSAVAGCGPACLARGETLERFFLEEEAKVGCWQGT